MSAWRSKDILGFLIDILTLKPWINYLFGILEIAQLIIPKFEFFTEHWGSEVAPAFLCRSERESGHSPQLTNFLVISTVYNYFLSMSATAKSHLFCHICQDKRLHMSVCGSYDFADFRQTSPSYPPTTYRRPPWHVTPGPLRAWFISLTIVYVLVPGW